MDAAVSPRALPRCARCATELASTALACPACQALVHGVRLRELAGLAVAATERGDRPTARGLWEEAHRLVPEASEQHREIGRRLAELDDDATGSTGDGSPQILGKGLIGAAAAVGLLLAGKFKFLLLGLTKLGTFTSMFGFIAVYWSLYGWPLAAGLAGTIYIHEMGHVSMLRRLGIRADAPLFIPGIGALVLLRQAVTDPVVNARIGLAGPVWGLAAATAAWVIYVFSEAPIWWAIAELTGFLNLFNLIPIWQLDGSRGFDALSMEERWSVVAVVAATAWLTSLGLLWLVGLVALYRTLATQPGPGHRATCVTFALLLPALALFARSIR